MLSTTAPAHGLLSLSLASLAKAARMTNIGTTPKRANISGIMVWLASIGYDNDQLDDAFGILVAKDHPEIFYPTEYLWTEVETVLQDTPPPPIDNTPTPTSCNLGPVPTEWTMPTTKTRDMIEAIVDNRRRETLTHTSAQVLECLCFLNDEAKTHHYEIRDLQVTADYWLQYSRLVKDAAARSVRRSPPASPERPHSSGWTPRSRSPSPTDEQDLCPRLSLGKRLGPRVSTLSRREKKARGDRK